MILKRLLKFIHCFSRKKKIIHSFKSNAKNINYFTIFLQIVDVTLAVSNNYW